MVLVLGAHLWVKVELGCRPNWLIPHFPRGKDVLALADIDLKHSLPADRLVPRYPRSCVPRHLFELIKRMVGRPTTVSHSAGNKQCTRRGE